MCRANKTEHRMRPDRGHQHIARDRKELSDRARGADVDTDSAPHRGITVSPVIRGVNGIEWEAITRQGLDLTFQAYCRQKSRRQVPPFDLILSNPRFITP
jgi:hypothetical protein